MTTKKPKSPPVPSRPLGDAVADTRKLYDSYSHGGFAKAEVASALSLSATSGPFGQRIFSLKTYGLIAQNGDHFTVTERFQVLNSTPHGDAAFKQAALDAVRSSDTFRELLEEFKTKLPGIDTVAQRLETQKRFNADRAKQAATVLEKSMRYAEVLDGSGNILPIRETERTSADENDRNQTTGGQDDNPGGGGGKGGTEDDVHTGTLSLEITVGDDRAVIVRYPRDLSTTEAEKVGKVLNAVVS